MEKTSTFIFENDFSCAHLAFISFSFFLLHFFWKISSANVCDNNSSLKEIPKSKNKIPSILEDKKKTKTNFFPGEMNGWNKTFRVRDATT